MPHFAEKIRFFVTVSKYFSLYMLRQDTSLRKTFKSNFFADFWDLLDKR